MVIGQTRMSWETCGQRSLRWSSGNEECDKMLIIVKHKGKLWRCCWYHLYTFLRRNHCQIQSPPPSFSAGWFTLTLPAQVLADRSAPTGRAPADLFQSFPLLLRPLLHGTAQSHCQLISARCTLGLSCLTVAILKKVRAEKKYHRTL